MNPIEFQRLLNYHYAKQNKPVTSRQGRRHVKSNAKGCGQILKDSIVRNQIVRYIK